MSFPERGQIYWVNLDPVVGIEIAKTRPAVIISNDIGNKHAKRVIIAPLTSGGRGKIYPFEVGLAAIEGGLNKQSKVVFDQVRTVDKSRLGKRIGKLDLKRMKEVDHAIRLSLAVQCD